MLIYMFAVVLSLTMESPMVALEKIIFGATDTKKDIPDIPDNGSTYKAIEELAYDNIAMDNELKTEENIISKKNFINKQLNGYVASFSQSLDISGAVFTTGSILPQNCDLIHMSLDREQNTNL